MLSFAILLISLVLCGTCYIVKSKETALDTGINNQVCRDNRYLHRRHDDTPSMRLFYIFLLKIREKGGMMREFVQAVHPKLSNMSVFNRPSAESRSNLVQVIVQPDDRDEMYQFSQAAKVYLNDVAFCLEYTNK